MEARKKGDLMEKKEAKAAISSDAAVQENSALAAAGISGGPVAPKDPQRKRPGFYIIRNKEVCGNPQPDGRGIQFLYQDDGRMISSARVVGNVKDEKILKLLETVEGFRKLVYSLGVTVELEPDVQPEPRQPQPKAQLEPRQPQLDVQPEPRQPQPESQTGRRTDAVDFVFQMYGKKGAFGPAASIRASVPGDGREVEIPLEEVPWTENDGVPGQIRFEFPSAGQVASVSVKFYLQDGYEAPEELEESKVDFSSPYYEGMLRKSLTQMGNPARLKKALDKARRGEDVTIAFIGGSITQGAGAVPIHRKCYAYEAFRGLCAYLGKGTEENIHLRKAGVGGTPSELGLVRYERDVLRMGEDGKIEEPLPDIVVVEFAVNDEGDETKGECFDSLVRKILKTENHPAVILLFAVFVDDWNLQERLSPVGRAYDLPMVSVRDAVVEQFYLRPDAGRMISKNQFFYDRYHPTNAGHRIMADCILHLIREADRLPESGGAAQEDGVLPYGTALQADETVQKKEAIPDGASSSVDETVPDEISSAKKGATPDGSLLGGIASPEDETVQTADIPLDQILPPLGGVFEDIKPLDRNCLAWGEGSEEVYASGSGRTPLARIDCGDFREIDADLQMVEMDGNLVPTGEFPYNWKYGGGKAAGEAAPFVMEICCTSLLLVFKDSGSPHVGRAEVWVDGEKALLADPHLNGWTHCNAVICFRGKDRCIHRVEVRMAEGQEDKEFTILGFGYVE